MAIAVVQRSLMLYGKTTKLKSTSNLTNPELIVSAASSMKNVLEEISSLYLAENPQTKLTYNFGSSGSLQRQIEQGAPVDIFISAASREMNNLQKQSLLVAETRQDIVKNQMVLIVNSNNNEIKDIADLAKIDDEKIAIGEPNSVPAGQYAKEILTHFNIWSQVRPQTVYAKDVRQVLNYVATNNIEAGIVYLSDTKNAKVKIAATVPEQIHSSIVYPAAVVKNSNKPAAAKDFIKFLSTPKAQAVFQQYGFTSVE